MLLGYILCHYYTMSNHQRWLFFSYLRYDLYLWRRTGHIGIAFNHGDTRLSSIDCRCLIRGICCRLLVIWFKPKLDISRLPINVEVEHRPNSCSTYFRPWWYIFNNIHCYCCSISSIWLRWTIKLQSCRTARLVVDQLLNFWDRDLFVFWIRGCAWVLWIRIENCKLCDHFWSKLEFRRIGNPNQLVWDTVNSNWWHDTTVHKPHDYSISNAK